MIWLKQSIRFKSLMVFYNLYSHFNQYENVDHGAINYINLVDPTVPRETDLCALFCFDESTSG